MTLKIRSLWIVPALIALVFGLTTCADPFEEKYPGESGAELLELRISSLGEDALELPEAIGGFEWDFSGFNLVNADFVTLEFNRESDVTLVRLRPTTSRRAWVEWGIGSRSARPEIFYAYGVPATLNANDYLYIKVASEDGNNFNYYRFLIRVYSSVTHLAGITIDGIKGDVKPGGGTWEDADEGSISITVVQAQPATIEYETFDINSTVRFAKVPHDAPDGPNDTEPTGFSDSNELTFEDQDLLYIEVTAQNTVDKAYYRFLVSVGRIATIKTLKIIRGEYEKEVMGKGSPADDWATALPGGVDTAEQDAVFDIVVVPDDPEATFEFAVVNPSAGKPNWTPVPAWTVVTTGADFNAIGTGFGVKVVSDNGLATLYYKIQVDVLAAEFTVQPASDYYYYYDADMVVGPGVDDLNWYEFIGLTGANAVSPSHPNFSDPVHGAAAVRPLSFELNRGTIPGATYQWYEANSWYGGYGFDADGRMAYKTTEGEEKQETGFTENAYHITGLDEKGNVSLHNGGNTYYRLEYPGREIAGETGPTYTPTIGKRPFLKSFTSESHYYWVVVTDPDTGRTVTSKRAVIVTEWDPRKAHYIVNLHAYLDTTGATYGLQDNPKNAAPFTAGNHGDKYEIPMTFPDDFDIWDYSVVTAQALFFLADGRPWIQNWTQGDFGFSNEDQNRLVLWYNLTNDNATRGLSGTGNEPEKSGLDETPHHLIVQPAGTSPIDQLPPFSGKDEVGRDKPDEAAIKAAGKTAQGWFTPYIEICELRFEGPTRKTTP